MKRTTTIAGVIVLVGMAYSGSAWYVGKQAQKSITHAVAQTNERAVHLLGPDLTGSRFRIDIRDYQRGVFSSSAQYVIHTMDAQGEPMEYVLQDDLQHGPLPFSLLRSGSFAPMLAYSQAHMVVTPSVAEWFDARQGETPLEIRTRVGFGGKGRSHWMFSPFEAASTDQRVSFSGGHLQIDFSDGFSSSTAQGQFDHYALIDNAWDEKVEVRGIRLDSTGHVVGARTEQHAAVKIETLTISGVAGENPIMLDDLTIELTGTQEQNILNAQFRYDIQGTVIDNNDLGQMVLSGSAGQLDIAALADLQRKYADMARQRGPGTEPGFDLTEDEQIALQNALRPVLQAEPTIAFDSAWKNASGESRAAASMTLKDPGETDNANLLEVLRDVVRHATLDVAIDRSMIVTFFQQVGAGDDVDPEQAGEFGGMLFDEYAQLLAEMGVARQDNGSLTLSLDASPSDDTVIFNGESLTTDQFLMRVVWLMLMPMSLSQ